MLTGNVNEDYDHLSKLYHTYRENMKIYLI